MRYGLDENVERRSASGSVLLVLHPGRALRETEFGKIPGVIDELDPLSSLTVT
jgi:hypothetical protein